MRIETDPGTATELADGLKGTVEVDTGFSLNGQGVRSRLGKGPKKTVGLDNHQMDVDGHVCRATQRGQNRYTHRNVWNKSAIHHVKMEPVRPGCLQTMHFLTKTTEIRRQKAWCNQMFVMRDMR